jgi:hypothetical protein
MAWPSQPNGTMATGVRLTPPSVISMVSSACADAALNAAAMRMSFLSTIPGYLVEVMAIVQV